VLQEFSGGRIRAFVVWEPVLPTDWSAPSTAALNRLRDSRADQYWDKNRLISHLLGEHDRDSIVWDQIAVYARGAVWGQQPPAPAFAGRTVVSKIEQAQAAVSQALAGAP
jgi:hypothetical protein